MTARSVEILLGALSIAAIHALIPSHWLAFAIIGRAHRWTIRRTLQMTALAGAGHILMTIVLGVLLAAAGKVVLKAIPPALEHLAVAASLLLVGLYFVVPALRGRGGCPHSHAHDVHLAEEAVGSETASSSGRRIQADTTTFGMLVLGMTLSPCLDLLSVYVAAARLSWAMIALISLAMAVTTLVLMVGLVWLTLLGLRRLRLHWLEHNERLVVGSVLIALGLLLFLIKD